MAPSVTVVICTRDRVLELERCLQHVRKLRYALVEVIVVDSAPQQGRVDELATRYGARYVHEDRPGLSRARNTGAALSSGEILAYLDDDAFPAADWLEALVEPFADPSVVVVTGGIVTPEPKTEIENRWEAMGALRPASSKLILDRTVSDWFLRAHYAAGIGANMALRRSVFKGWRGFNEDLGRGQLIPTAEERYAFVELIGRGYRLVHEPRAVVYHWHPAPTSEEQLRSRYLQSLRENATYFTYVFTRSPQYLPHLARISFRYAKRLMSRKQDLDRTLAAARVSRLRHMMVVSSGVMDYLRRPMGLTSHRHPR